MDRRSTLAFYGSSNGNICVLVLGAKPFARVSFVALGVSDAYDVWRHRRRIGRGRPQTSKSPRISWKSPRISYKSSRFLLESFSEFWTDMQIVTDKNSTLKTYYSFLLPV